MFRGCSKRARRLAGALMRASALRATTSATLRALELAVAFSPSDFASYRATSATPSALPKTAGLEYSGSHAARNIEKIYAAAERAGMPCSLESALDCCFGEPAPLRHVLVCSGFFVLHGRGGAATPGLDDAAGTCETDGPLGALALLRALVARGAAVSLLRDAHNGPVFCAAYDAMLSYVEAEAGGAPAALLRERSRCLPTVWDRAPPGESADEAAASRRSVATRAPPSTPTARSALRTASQVGAAGALRGPTRRRRRGKSTASSPSSGSARRTATSVAATYQRTPSRSTRSGRRIRPSRRRVGGRRRRRRRQAPRRCGGAGAPGGAGAAGGGDGGAAAAGAAPRTRARWRSATAATRWGWAGWRCCAAWRRCGPAAPTSSRCRPTAATARATRCCSAP